MVNTQKIKAKIVEKGLTIREIAPIMHLSAFTLGKKINGVSDMSLSEADALQNILGISDSEYRLYFFAS